MDADEARVPFLADQDLPVVVAAVPAANIPDSDPDVDFVRTPTPRFRQILASLISSLAPLSFGLVLGYSSPTIAGLKQDQIIDEDTTTWFASFPTLGALLGGVMGGFLVNKLGRKGTLIACGLPFVLGWLMIIAVKMTSSFALLLVGRFLGGTAMGVVCIAGPNYIAEIASPDLRGALGTFFQVAVTVGLLLAFAIGIPLSWVWLAVVCAIFATMMTIFVFFIPETPSYLAGKGLHTQALHSLRWFRGNSYDIEGELERINSTLENSPNASFSLHEFTSRSVYKPVLLTMGLMVFQQCSGINDVLFYANPIFASAKFSGDPAIPGVIIAAVQVVATVASIFVIDRLGRKILLCISGSLMSVGCIALGVNYYLQEHGNGGLSWLPVVSLILYVAAFSIGWGPIPWLQMAELIPGRVKGIAGAIAVITNWSSAFVVSKEFNGMEKVLGTYGTFWLFASINALGVIFTLVLLPETKGKSLEEIENHFASQ